MAFPMPEWPTVRTSQRKLIKAFPLKRPLFWEERKPMDIILRGRMAYCEDFSTKVNKGLHPPQTTPLLGGEKPMDCNLGGGDVKRNGHGSELIIEQLSVCCGFE
ncbi:hypothetical protein CEXT_96161 [Caerostris extrusa]|uniref:Uncharacterized protein n=1 Tax=Caerostris extrusa TaxID=172846 RepID=A0AAV4W2E2_CAEEX|nr:hypothetical protein CEXT_96161 [Caerostris extrusa]